MLITNLIIRTFLAKFPSRVFLEENVNRIQQIFKYSFSDEHTICNVANGKAIYHEFWMNSWVPVVVINPQAKNRSIKFCNGYAISVKDTKDFLGILSNYRFPPHKKVLLFLEEEYQETLSLRRKINEMALTLIVVHKAQNYHNDTLNVATKIFFAMENKTKILDKDKVVREDFSGKWTPKLWSEIGKSIRVSLFHCPPYVIVKRNRTGYTLKGIDFKIFRNIAKDWPVEFLLEEEQENIRDNLFIKIIEKVVNKESDIAMCGLWQRVILEKKLDMSRYNSAQCITFLVAKPTLLGDETFIFQPFTDVLWLCTSTVLCTIFIFKIFFSSYYRSNKTSVFEIGELFKSSIFFVYKIIRRTIQSFLL